MTEDEFVKQLTENQAIFHKICNLYAFNKENKEDLFQEITFQLWKSVKNFNPKKNIKFTTWMYRVALNTAISGLRKSNKNIHTDHLADNILLNIPEEINSVLDPEFKELYAAIQKLNKIERAIILLFLENKNYKEISEITGLTESNVGVKLNRIKKKLKTILNHGE